MLDKYFTEADFKEGIENPKCNKSSGTNELTIEYLKSTEEIAVLDKGSIPSSWQFGKIVAIYKKGDNNEARNYRAITIRSCLGKKNTQLLDTRLSPFVNIHEKQAGTIDYIFVTNAL